jgi:hypothetical protein
LRFRSVAKIKKGILIVGLVSCLLVCVSVFERSCANGHILINGYSIGKC